ncbi:glycosyltransferase [Candidatus Bathyarchaeota archaeon]|nr:glycosyltransferase [Candidatus Bathyarchaeota archaeon]
MINDLSAQSRVPIEWPFVSIIVAVYNEERRINMCLTSLASINYKSEYEVLVIDGMSTDSTSKLIEEFCVNHPNFKCFKNQKIIASAGRNIGITESSGVIVAFTDGDIVVEKDWLTTLVGSLIVGETKLAGVGGPNLLSSSATFGERCIRFAASTFFGSGRSIQYAYRVQKKYVNSLSTCNAAYWKHILLEMKGFDERLLSGGDLDLNLRLRKKGYLLKYIPEAKVTHYQDESVKSFINRMIYYGILRTKMLKKHPLGNIPYILLMLVGLVSLLLLPFYIKYFPYIFIGYISISWIFAVPLVLKNKTIPEFVLTPIFNLIEHVTYFVGIIIGAFK